MRNFKLLSFKKITAVLTALCVLACAAFSVAAIDENSADDEGIATYKGATFRYRSIPELSEYGDYIEIYDMSDFGSVVTIPAYLDGKPVEKISSLNIRNNTIIEKIAVENGVEIIEGQPFFDQVNLEEIHLPNSLFLFDACFEGTAYYNNEENWEDGVLYSGVHAIGAKRGVTSLKFREGTRILANNIAADSESLKSVSLPPTLGVIGNYAFFDCVNLKEITVPPNVVYIGDYALGITSQSEYHDYSYYYVDGFTMKCAENSYAQSYADYYGINYKTDNTIPLETPYPIYATSIQNGILLEWQPVTMAEKYRVYLKTDDGWERIGETDKTKFTCPVTEQGKNYTFTVRCVSADGKRFTSDYSRQGVTTFYTEAPKNIKAENTIDGVKLSWEKIDGAEKYYVMFFDDDEWYIIDETTNLTYTDTTAKSGETYLYSVCGYTKKDEYYSLALNADGVTVKYIAAPIISEIEYTSNGLKINWDAVEGADVYRVFVLTDNGWNGLGNTASTTFTDKNVEEGKTYTYTLRCISSDQKSFTSDYYSDGTSFTVPVIHTTVPTEHPVPEPVKYAIGDVNKDGNVNLLDRIYLTRFTASWNGYLEIDPVIADLNSDGSINLVDRMILTRHLAGWVDYTVLPRIILISN